MTIYGDDRDYPDGGFSEDYTDEEAYYDEAQENRRLEKEDEY